MEVRVLRNVGGKSGTVTNRRELPVPGTTADQLGVRHEIVSGPGSPLEPSKWRYASYATGQFFPQSVLFSAQSGRFPFIQPRQPQAGESSSY